MEKLLEVIRVAVEISGKEMFGSEIDQALWGILVDLEEKVAGY